MRIVKVSDWESVNKAISKKTTQYANNSYEQGVVKHKIRMGELYTEAGMMDAEAVNKGKKVLEELGL